MPNLQFWLATYQVGWTLTIRVVNESTRGRRTCPALHALQAAPVPVNPEQIIITTGNILTVEQGERIAVSIQHVM